MTKTTKFLLDEKDIPTHWYNLNADLAAGGVTLPPVLHPGTGQPVGPADLAPLFPMALIQQEVTAERYVEIPEEVRDIYRLWRPSPLYRAHAWEKKLGTPAKIYYKYEGVSYAGSHKPNSAIPQAYYNAKAGIKRLTTETGAGQWGSSLAFACQRFGLECKIYMVRVSYEQKPHRRNLMEAWGATVVPSPSAETNAGRAILAADPKSTGSLGIAISEAVEVAAQREDTNYALGSVLNHVLLHQTVVGQETIKQLELAGADWPDIIIGCVGGGSNFGGFAFPFLREKLVNKKKLRAIAAEPLAAPSLTRGVYAYDFGDTAMTTPLLKMYTLGHGFMPPPIHAGGLRYHGMNTQVSALYDAGVIEAKAVGQNSVFEAAISFTRSEGILPAPESSHAIRVAMDEALACKASGEAKTIVFNLSGHGHFDLSAYEQYLQGKLKDAEYSADAVKEALKGLPKVG